MDALDLLDRPIAYHRVFFTITGSLKAAVMLGQAVYWSKRTRDPEGWFYKSAKDWEQETGLTRHEQDAARGLLADVLETKLAKMPATLHFRVSAENLQTWLAKNVKPVCRKVANKDAENRQTTNSTESTAESTALAGRSTGPARSFDKKVPTHPLALRICAIFHRKPTTPWSDKEIRAYREVGKAIQVEEAEAAMLGKESEFQMVERWYAKHWPPDRDKNTLRHNMITFLNNYAGEIDKARPWADRHPQRRAKPTINITPPPELPRVPDDPVAAKRFAEQFQLIIGRPLSPTDPEQRQRYQVVMRDWRQSGKPRDWDWGKRMSEVVLNGQH